MSHAARIDYQALSLQCKAVCGVAEKQLCRIDSMLKKISSSSTTLASEKITSYQTYLTEEKTNIENKIRHLVAQAEIQATLGTRTIEDGVNRPNLIAEATELQRQVDDIAISKIEVLNKLIDEELGNIGTDNDKKIRNSAYGVISLSNNLINQINSIHDIGLRELVLEQARKEENQTKTFNALLTLGQKALTDMSTHILESRRKTIINEIRQEMEEAKVDAALIDKTINTSGDILSIRSKATSEIIGEVVRKETLKIILKAIEARGFLVDRRNNIKIDRENNEVNLIGKKSNGQFAEFKIYLDGKFQYRFDGFEGQACQKDLDPFMKDLEEVYGLKITGKTEIWSNPDKLTSKKYQAINTNKGKN